MHRHLGRNPRGDAAAGAVLDVCRNCAVKLLLVAGADDDAGVKVESFEEGGLERGDS